MVVVLYDDTSPMLERAVDGRATEETGDIPRPRGKPPETYSPERADQEGKVTSILAVTTVAYILACRIEIVYTT